MDTSVKTVHQNHVVLYLAQHSQWKELLNSKGCLMALYEVMVHTYYKKTFCLW